VEFDPERISYSELLVVFWDRIDPTTLNRQGNDRGSQYRSGIYYHNETQKEVAHSSKETEQLKYSVPIVTEILPIREWYRAEEYHQRYLEKGGQCARSGDISPIRCYG
jgi:peptide-methionine (S)-S-oxide reductase